MKITRRQLRRIIKEALDPSTPEEQAAYQRGVDDGIDGRYDHYFKPKELVSFYDAGNDYGMDERQGHFDDDDPDYDDMDAETEYATPQHAALSDLLGPGMPVEDSDERYFVVSALETDAEGEFRRWKNDRIGMLIRPINSDEVGYDDDDNEYTAEQLAQWLRTQGAKVG